MVSPWLDLLSARPKASAALDSLSAAWPTAAAATLRLALARPGSLPPLTPTLIKQDYMSWLLH